MTDADHPGFSFATELASSLNAPSSPGRMAAYVLRTRSRVGLDVMARAASDGAMDAATILGTAEDGRPLPGGTSAPWVRHLARVLALLTPETARSATALFEAAADLEGLEDFEVENADVFAQVLLRTHQLDRLDELLDHLPLSPAVRRSVRSDRLNPFLTGGGTVEAWLGAFNEMFTADGLEPVELADPTAGTPFERLRSLAPALRYEGELVSVVMPVYRPDNGILTAVRSVLAQTWTNVEMIVVDDASPPEFDDVLAQVAGLDDRVRVVHLPENGGTYQARNRGLAEARGTFVTFQDADDWSHPRRIERQVAPLVADPALLATRSRAVRAYPDLSLTYPGYSPERLNASSLLFRRTSVLQRLGGFDAVRKSADIEFPQRLRAVVRDSLLDMDGAPLAVVQLRHDSLSRADATPGWIRWSRIAYRNAYQQWHKSIRSGRASATLGPTRPFPLPETSWAPERREVEPQRVDVVVVNDWRARRPGLRRRLNELTLMQQSGLRVAVAHVETPLPLATRRAPLAPALQRLLNAGTVPLVHLSQDVAARLLYVAHPDVAQFLPDTAELGAEAVVVELATADDPVPDLDPTPRPTVAECQAQVQRTFGLTAQWLARDDAAHAELTAVDGAALVPVRPPLAVASPHLRASRRPAGRRPVVGAQPVELLAESLGTWDAVLEAFPDDDALDVRHRGDARAVQRSLGKRTLPPNWLVYAPAEVTVRDYLAQLDVLVLPLPAPLPLSARQSVVEAMAAGCPVVLDPSTAHEFGDAALYATPEECVRTVEGLYASPDVQAGQIRRGREHADRLHGTFRTELDRLIDVSSTGTVPSRPGTHSGGTSRGEHT
ncbi:Glycosyl transferase family 2 [Georgenia satyanarayanai]|uniref:Glycosyl transferase family 2 n=1 Tax=Georgenia satyanarayanai TaxID=860221 RepID=A0A2Y9AFB7_9MICO|nr:glycosyltransferase family 2 protein [Georgenia satyanarayanai]PYF99399.1 glycosyl transferase family 2 [Georgenia satyanarayanai]SSA43211.1 Glycosyl transferase family 2 [Georgenia satyanarayanai]